MNKLMVYILIILAIGGLHVLTKNYAVSKAVNETRIALIKEWEGKVQTSVLAATKTSKQLLQETLKDNAKKDAKLKDISAKLAALNRSLQDRPNRTSTANTTGASGIAGTCTGTELFRQDAEFLTGEAARADKIKEERDYYYDQYERARQGLAALQEANGGRNATPFDGKSLP